MKRNKIKKIALIGFTCILLVGATAIIFEYPTPKIDRDSKRILLIKPNDTHDSVLNNLVRLYPNIPKFIIKFQYHTFSFSKKLQPGKYSFSNLYKFKNIIKKIITGKQDNIVLHINTQLKYPEDFYNYLDVKLFYSSEEFNKAFKSTQLIDLFGKDSTNIFFCLIPNDYNVLWTAAWINTSKTLFLFFMNLHRNDSPSFGPTFFWAILHS